MPVVHSSNNSIIPSNTRAVDVARDALFNISSIQQRRYHNAFEVNGYDCIVYNKLRQGEVCSCQGRQKTFTSLLKEDGKLPMEVMDKMLTGGLEFKINLNPTSRSKPSPDMRNSRGYALDTNPNTFTESKRVDGVSNDTYDVKSSKLSEGLADTIVPELLDEDADFDDNVSLQDSPCAVCFGTGWIGGYSVLNGFRKVLSSTSAKEVDGTIEYNTTPFSFFAKSVAFAVVLPKGFYSLDCFKVWNNTKVASAAKISIDNIQFSSLLFKSLSDGREHTIRIDFDELTYFTHLEIQSNLSSHFSKIEFPKFDLQKLESSDYTADVGIVASSQIPNLYPGDILAESFSNKLFMIASSSPLADSFRNYYGWDCNSRVIQGSEILNMLPRRPRLVDTRTSNFSKDNASGIRRT